MNFFTPTTYQTLPPAFYKVVKPTPVSNPVLFFWNTSLAKDLSLSLDGETENSLALLFSGNQTFPDSWSLAQAYAGHQYGNFTMLGDGRAILLGEVLNSQNQRYDVQLKGSGRTPFSRGGDGRATLYSMLREYLISESMHHLGIPTTRSLAVVQTGDPVYREETQMGGILTRIAQSHIRVGTFEYAYQFLTPVEIQSLLDYAIQRHYPEVKESENSALAFFEAVMKRQISLLIHWLRVGFVHGVMNTDNMSIPGETIDYGPCAFMNAYHGQTVFSSIDKNGRYAYANQINITHWNLACLANALLPVIHKDTDKAIELAKSSLDRFGGLFKTQYWDMISRKIGFSEFQPEHKDFVRSLYIWMEKMGADYTNTFLVLEEGMPTETEVYKDKEFQEWKAQWIQILQTQNQSIESAKGIMKKENPFFIPRNHLVEEALLEGKLGKKKKIEELLKKLSRPYDRIESYDFHSEVPSDGGLDYRTYCGT